MREIVKGADNTRQRMRVEWKARGVLRERERKRLRERWGGREKERRGSE